MRQTLKKVSIVSVVLFLACVFCSLPSFAQQDGKRVLKVMTYNVNEGTDYVEVLSAQSFPDFLQAVQFTLDSVKASNPPLRMQAVAHQIAMQQPDLVGLQEVTTWRVGLGPNPSPVLFDMLQELLDALKAQGQDYSVAVVIPEFFLQAPLPDLATFVSASNTDVILARNTDALQLSSVQSGNFSTLLSAPTLLGPLTILRGWGSVDVTLNGVQTRFIVTHLENYFPQLPATIFFQMSQAGELLLGPANTTLPVIVAGDFNADGSNPNDPTFATYQEMLNAGFGDAWAAVHPLGPGLTWQLVDSSAVPTTATQRIDFIFFRGPVRGLTANLAGNRTQDRVGGLWPSDHAGVKAALLIGWE